MGKLKIISVTGAVPHTACFFDYADVLREDNWRGFGPAAHRSPVGRGKVFTDDETYRINHAITFAVPDTILTQACNKVSDQYKDKYYALGICDCVSFSADAARECGLGVPLINMTPYGLIQILRVWNDYIDYS